MIVKIFNKDLKSFSEFDANDQPIVLILTDEDKQNLQRMIDLGATKYCAAPDTMSDKEVQDLIEPPKKLYEPEDYGSSEPLSLYPYDNI
jgi:hypothetical protein